MLNPNVYTLCAKQLTAAVSAEAQSPIVNLDGMQAVTLEARLIYGSGGTSVIARVQTSFDEGQTWRDVARFDFATTSLVKWANISGLSPKGVSTLTALGAEGVTDGLLGDRLRVEVTSVGAYVDTVLSVKAAAR